MKGCRIRVSDRESVKYTEMENKPEEKLGVSPASQLISSPKPAQYGRCLPGVRTLCTVPLCSTQRRGEIVFFFTVFSFILGELDLVCQLCRG